MKEVSTISKRKSRSRPQNRRQQPRPVNKGYGDAGASWHKKATKGFRAMSGSPKEDIDANNYTLRQRARMLYMAAPIATSAIRTNRTNVVGIGLQLKSRIDREALGMTQEAADAWQAQAEREFALWSENKRACDATGVNNFAAMQQLALSSWLVSGDVFAVVKQYEPTPLTPYSLRLHLIEADRVATPTTSGIITPMLLTTGKAANGNTIYDGVEVNDDGQIEAYHIRSTYPFELGSTTTTWARVQAYGERTGLPNILHVMESERPDQYRGVSYLAQVIEPLLQLRRYTESELTAAVVESFSTAFIKTEAGAGDNPFNEVGSSLPEVSRDPNEYEMGPGQINIMEPGEDVTFADPKRPASGFNAFLRANGGEDISVIAKIENQPGIDNIEEIFTECTGIMIARGDMGVEVPYEELPSIQKELIGKCRLLGKRVITATEMLESMTHNIRPTRAELADVANAVYDGTSAIMLSGETAAGEHPVEALSAMARIAEYTEAHINYAKRFPKTQFEIHDTLDAISHATCGMAIDIGAKVITVCSITGRTARLISRFRGPTDIIGLTTNERAYRKLALSWGITPVMSEVYESTDVLFYHALQVSRQVMQLEKGDKVIITGGIINGRNNNTNTIKVEYA